jgi:Protein of unknown function (DUF1559)
VKLVRCRIGVAALILGTVACSSDNEKPSPALDAGVFSGDAAAPDGASTEKGYDSPLTIALDVGGPYEVAAGASLALSATFGVAGQADETADLQAIGSALAAYEAQHGSFPPSALSNADGKPLLSWRVLLLPYLGQTNLYTRFDLTKAWDDPANLPLVNAIPDVYRDGAGLPSGNTSYAGVAGSKQPFRTASASLGGGVKKSDVTDGENMTFAVGPVGGQVSLPWTAPGDIAIASHLQLGKADGFAGAGGVVTPMLFLDGEVRGLLNSSEPSLIRGWATTSGDSCHPPASLDIGLSAQWDRDGDGTFETLGSKATFSSSQSGSHDVGFRVVDRFGGVHATTAKVVVR